MAGKDYNKREIPREEQMRVREYLIENLGDLKVKSLIYDPRKCSMHDAGIIVKTITRERKKLENEKPLKLDDLD